MWRNYLVVGLRSLVRERTYAFINVFGLAVGVAACLILLLYVRYESTYDRWLPGNENVYQLQTLVTNDETGAQDRLQKTQYVAGTTLQQDFPQIERRVYAMTSLPTVIRGGEALAVGHAMLVDGNLFDVLQLPMVRGEAGTALSLVGSVVLSESEARRIFGTLDVVGRTITIVDRNERADRTVTGVFRDLPRNSSLRLDMAVRFNPATYFADTPAWLTSWGDINGWTFLRLRPGADPAQIHAGMAAWRQRHIARTDSGGDPGRGVDWRLVDLADVHLSGAQDPTMTPGNDSRTILTFTIVALLILAMACANFVNLATARASQRAREVALRKVLGARRVQLIVQFLGETILVASIATLIALAALELFLPSLSRFLDADLRMDYFGAAGMALPVVGLILAVGAVGGLYPAFYLSGFRPARVLKANRSAGEAGGTGPFRNTLVVAQFAVSIGLIICTSIVYAQTRLAQNDDPGYQRHNLIQIAIEGIPPRQRAALSETMIRQFERIEGVTAAGLTSIGIATPNRSATSLYLRGRDEPVRLGHYRVDDGFFRTMGMTLLAGRGFDRSRPIDESTGTTEGGDPAVDQALIARGANVVINELAAQQMGFRRPQDAVGAQAQATFLATEGSRLPVTVVGVVKDTRFRSVREPVEPILFRFADDFLSHIVIRYDAADPQAVRDRIEQAWRRLAPDVPFDAAFSDEIVGNLYEAENARGQAFAGFALLAVTVACLGLFGLAAFTAERRTREIGIRKVFGARTRDIVQLLAWQFARPVVVANLLAWPVAYWVMRDWLNTFDNRIALTPTPFLVAGLLALAVAVGTVAGHAIRVARTNPIVALRYE